MNSDTLTSQKPLVRRNSLPNLQETCRIRLNSQQLSNPEANSNQSSILHVCPPGNPDSNKTWAEIFNENRATEAFLCHHQKVIACKCCAAALRQKKEEIKEEEPSFGRVSMEAPEKAKNLQGLLNSLKYQQEMLKNDVLQVMEKIKGEINEWYHENVLRLCSIKATFFNDLLTMESKLIESTALEADVKGFEEKIMKLRNSTDRTKGLEGVIEFCELYLDDSIKISIKKKTEILRKIRKSIVAPGKPEMRKKLDKLVTICDKNVVHKIKFPVLVNVDLYSAADIVKWLNLHS